MELNDLKGLYIAHRGIQTSNTVENTIPAFSLALDKKVPIEFDLHFLKDGNIVVFHDNNLKRLTGIDRCISGYTYEELKKITLTNTDVHIPLFEEVLELIKGKVMLVIEIKTSGKFYRGYCKKIVSLLKKYPYNFVIKSFDIRIVNWFLRYTDYVSGLLIIKREKSFYDWVMRRKLVINLLKPDFISVDYKIISNKMVQDFRKKGPVFVWTIRDVETLNKVREKADSYLIEKFYF